MDVNPSPKVSEMEVVVFILWTERDSGELNKLTYDEMMVPFDRMTKGAYSVKSYSLPLSMLSNMASSFENPKDHRRVVVGNYSKRFFDRDSCMIVSREMKKRVRDTKVFFTQIVFDHKWTQWRMNKGMNALGWRDFRIFIDDWLFYQPSERRLSTIIASMESFHRKLPWSKSRVL